ncbi:MAG: hypothetical protein ACK4IY_00225 [Chitinophagales bacterium]
MLLSSFETIAQLTEIEPNTQEPSKPGKSGIDASRWIVGGYLGAQFGNFTAIDISPMVGYRVTPKLTAGGGLTYQYVSFKDPTGYYIPYKSNIIGPRAFAAYNLIFGLQAHVEYEHLWFRYEDSSIEYKDKQPGLFLGGGLNLAAGKNAVFQILALYNVLWDASNVVYGSPLTIRFGMGFGL